MTERKRNVGGPTFHFPSVIFNISNSLKEGNNMSKKGYDRVSWWFMFHRAPLPSFSVKSKFWSQWEVWLLKAVSVPTYSVAGVMLLPCTCFESCWTSLIMRPLILCAWGIHMLSVNRVARNGANAHCMYLFCSHTCSIFSSDLIYKRQTQR